MDEITAQAVKKTLEGKWEEATKLNQQILVNNPEDTQALNRLARAQAELGKIKEAHSTYLKVLKIDSLNVIAKKNLDRLKSLKSGKTSSHIPRQADSDTFLEEPGKTKTVSLVKLSSPDILSQFNPGDKVDLTPRQHCISVISGNITIGRLPDDISARLQPLIRGGNIYSTIIRSIMANSVKVLIKEEKRGKRFQNTPSFPTTDHASYNAYIPAELIEDPSAREEGSEESEEQS